MAIINKRIYDYSTGKWVIRPIETDSQKVEIGILDSRKIKALGLVEGMKTKSFSDLNEEEQKLFTEEESDNDSAEKL